MIRRVSPNTRYAIYMVTLSLASVGIGFAMGTLLPLPVALPLGVMVGGFVGSQFAWRFNRKAEQREN